jgi:hypothetical protein
VSCRCLPSRLILSLLKYPPPPPPPPASARARVFWYNHTTSIVCRSHSCIELECKDSDRFLRGSIRVMVDDDEGGNGGALRLGWARSFKSLGRCLKRLQRFRSPGLGTPKRTLPSIDSDHHAMMPSHPPPRGTQSAGTQSRGCKRACVSTNSSSRSPPGFASLAGARTGSSCGW